MNRLLLKLGVMLFSGLPLATLPHRLGLRLREAMEALGKECDVSYHNGPKENLVYRNTADFFCAKLKKE
ncbi:MAG: hypothetical protein AB8B91_17235 [Rubripirellula sp.]